MRIFAYAASVVLIGALSACGGGGGGSGGGGAFVLPVVTPLTVNVAVNGTAATPDASGTYSVKPGDTVQITPSQSVDWSSTSTDAGAVTLRSTDISSARWSAQIANGKATPETLTVSAKATANAALTKDAVLKVAAGNSRNGQYKVFATNGSQQTLALDFDTMSYVMTNSSGAAVSDAFAADATQAGAYVFQSARIVATKNTARFRFTGGGIVGSFPFTLPFSTVYTVQPFVAAQNFVTDQASLDGFYNRLGVDFTGSVRNSQIRSAQIANGGTKILFCNDVAIHRVDVCTPGNVLTYTITPDAEVGKWDFVNVTNPADVGTFALAVIGGHSVYLSAGVTLNHPNNAGFRIGLLDAAAWPTMSARGGDTEGASDVFSFDATTYVSLAVKPDGIPSTVSYPVDVFAGPVGIRGINSVAGPNKYFAIQNGQLAVVVGAQGPIGGYMQIGTSD